MAKLCGIAGAVFCSVSPVDIENAKNELRNRGPDGHGVFSDDYITFVHRRLAVIDLTDAASQPMESPCGRYVIVFNGEIYNYRELRKNLFEQYDFRTESDTEVILAYYKKFGTKALDFFRGMFAFAIWDKTKRELFLARDRLGVKPLYFANTINGFGFASRPQALYKLLPKMIDRSIDKQALRYFFEAGYVPAPHSIFKGVNKLEPGCFITVSEKGLHHTRYWSINDIEIDQSLLKHNEETLLDELDALINASVRLRMVSDVPVGAFLSGGIDSSLVVAYMQKHSKEAVRTFTVGFQDKSFDESNYASAVASFLRTEHTNEILRTEDLLELMPTFIRNYDEPFFDYSAFPVMAVSRLAKKSVTVSLSGDGGDESFGGYHYYELMKKLETLHRIPKKMREMMGFLLKQAPSQRFRWLGEIVRANNAPSAYAFIRGVLKDATYLLRPSLLEATQPLANLFVDRASLFASGLSYAETGMRLDLGYTLPDDYLQKVDVGTMAFSLEARDPLLDHSIIEWAAKLPMGLKLQGGINKYLLRKLAYRHIPREILDRPKMGFGVPMAQWLRGGLRGWGESLLNEHTAFDALELDQSAVRQLWNAHQSCKLQAHTALWSVLVALQFYRSHLES